MHIHDTLELCCRIKNYEAMKTISVSTNKYIQGECIRSISSGVSSTSGSGGAIASFSRVSSGLSSVSCNDLTMVFYIRNCVGGLSTDKKSKLCICTDMYLYCF